MRKSKILISLYEQLIDYGEILMNKHQQWMEKQLVEMNCPV